MNFLQLKNSYRVLMNKKGYLLINVLGLGTGIASFLILTIYIYNDLTYNHFNKNLGNIYRIKENEHFSTKGLLLPEIFKRIPEVKNGTRIHTWDGFRISYKETAFTQNVQYTDTGFFSVFSFPFTEGSANPGINEKYGVVISTDFAEKLFGKESALGKKIQVRFEDKFLQVNGVVKIPVNSSIKFDMLASYETGMELSSNIKDSHDWYNTFSITYVLLNIGTDPKSIYPKLQDIVKEYFIPVGQSASKLTLFPFKEYHSDQESNKTLIIILTVIALGILGIAMINFINLTITASFSRTKEIGLKKVVGAGRIRLFGQMMTESLMVSFVALLIGLELASLFLPVFNRFLDLDLQIEQLKLGFLIPLLVFIWLIVGIMSGIIPSVFWWRVKLMQILQGKIFKPRKNYLPRYSLVIFQFIIAIILISGTLLIQKQVNFLIQKDPKFDKDNVVVINLNGWQYSDSKKASQKFKIISEQLKANPYVESVCFSANIPGLYHESYNAFYPEDGNKPIGLKQAYVGRDYFKTYGIKMLSGTGFDEKLVSYKNALVLNESAMKKLGYQEAAEQILHQSTETGAVFHIIGTVEDFSYQGAQNEMQPLVHFCYDFDDLNFWPHLSVRAKAGTIFKVISLIESAWENIEPVSKADYFFAIDKLNEYYKEYIRINKMIAWFSALAIILSCIGLFTLSSYALTKKTKEIGIRKVNGAKIYEILVLVNKDFLLCVMIAFIVATPAGWYAVHLWLEKFANKTEISWWVFALAGVIVSCIAFVTVIWQSWRAATRNPVEALRYE